MSASVKQRSFAESLFNERVIPTEMKERVLRRMADPGVTPRNLSADFDALLRCPRAPRETGDRGWPSWGDVQLSKYALPEGVVPQATWDALVSHGQTYLFFEIKEWRGRRYCNKLTGAPGSFSRTRVSAANQRALHDAIADADQQRRAAQLFGLIYTCCGSCGAELTDDRSRELHLGPECRRKFGLR